ncbi:MAG: hypothetical protein J7L91_00105 [Candidatus Korarchaeota archaeon]|nr:hypothetical protein [Candidatus Korarchaeota archaeon]
MTEVTTGLRALSSAWKILDEGELLTDALLAASLLRAALKGHDVGASLDELIERVKRALPVLEALREEVVSLGEYVDGASSRPIAELIEELRVRDPEDILRALDSTIRSIRTLSSSKIDEDTLDEIRRVLDPLSRGYGLEVRRLIESGTPFREGSIL